MEKLTDILKILLFAVFFAIPIQYFLIQPHRVSDDSMQPDYQEGDILLVSRIPYFSGRLVRGEVVVIRDIQANNNKYIRRIVGLPTERISINDGILSIRGEDHIIKELPLFGNTFHTVEDIGNLDSHEYFVIGDSNLQTKIGMVDKQYIIGRPFMRIWPVTKIKIFN